MPVTCLCPPPSSIQRKKPLMSDASGPLSEEVPFMTISDLPSQKPYLIIHRDRTIEYGEGYTPDRAAKEFWDAMSEQGRINWQDAAIANGWVPAPVDQ